MPSILLMWSVLPLVVFFFLSFALMFYSTEIAKLNKKTRLRIKLSTPAKLTLKNPSFSISVKYFSVFVQTLKSLKVRRVGPYRRADRRPTKKTLAKTRVKISLSLLLAGGRRCTAGTKKNAPSIRPPLRLAWQEAARSSGAQSAAGLLLGECILLCCCLSAESQGLCCRPTAG
jgi:uncharacterized protein (DUF58 family)